VQLYFQCFKYMSNQNSDLTIFGHPVDEIGLAITVKTFALHLHMQ